MLTYIYKYNNICIKNINYIAVPMSTQIIILISVFIITFVGPVYNYLFLYMTHNKYIQLY